MLVPCPSSCLEGGPWDSQAALSVLCPQVPVTTPYCHPSTWGSLHHPDRLLHMQPNISNWSLLRLLGFPGGLCLGLHVPQGAASLSASGAGDALQVGLRVQRCRLCEAQRFAGRSS